MLFGVTNAPRNFTRFTTFVFQPFFGKSIRVFLDVFCIYSAHANHCEKVEEGLKRLHHYGGQLNPDKCHVIRKEVFLLGHVISEKGVQVEPSKVKAILALPYPTSTKQVVTFNQKVRYMSRFIHLLSKVIAPLQCLANQSSFEWREEHEECFKEVKGILSSLPAIMPPNVEEPYYLEVVW